MPAFESQWSRRPRESRSIDLGEAPYFTEEGADITQPLQDAYDRLKALGGGTIRIPGKAYRLNGWFFGDGDRIRIVGDGTQITYGDNGKVLLGVTRSRPIPSTCFVSMTGIMDGTQGQRWGFRNTDPANPSSFYWLTTNSSALASGDVEWNWTKLNQLTVDIAIHVPAGLASLGSAMLCGAPSSAEASRIVGGSPFVLSASNGAFRLSFSTETTDRNRDDVHRTVTFAPAPGDPATGLIRLSFHIDLANAQVIAWVNRKQVVVTPTLLGPGFRSSEGMTFAFNKYMPFNIGTVNRSCFQNAGVIRGDVTFSGLRLLQGLWYANDGVGSNQRRLDGRSLTDRVQFYEMPGYTNPRVIAGVHFTDGPGSRLVSHFSQGYVTPYASNQGLFIVDDGQNFKTTYHNSYEHITAKVSSPWNELVGLGNILYARIRNLHCTEYLLRGIANYPFGANYVHDIENCWVQGYDASYHFVASILRMTNCNAWYPGAAAIRLVSSDAVITGLDGGENRLSNRHSIDMCGGAYSNYLYLDRILWDTESLPAGPTDAWLRVEGVGGAEANAVIIRNLRANLGVDTPLVSIYNRPRHGLTSHSKVVVDDVKYYGMPSTWIRIDDTQKIWSVEASEIPAKNISKLVRPVLAAQPSMANQVRFAFSDLQDLPYQGSWEGTGTTVQPMRPIPGQFRSWILDQSGKCGGGTGPRWTGIDPIASFGCIGGYVHSGRSLQVQHEPGLPTSLSTGLISEFRFAESTGLIVSDNSTRGKSMTAVKPISASTGPATPMLATAASFDGSQVYTLSNELYNDHLGPNGWTASGWVRLKDASGSQVVLFFGANQAYYQLSWESSKQAFRFAVGSNAADAGSVYSDTIGDPRSWRHIIVVHDTGETRMFVDGRRSVCLFRENIPSSGWPNGPIKFGSGGNPTSINFLRGDLAHWRIWNRTLTPLETDRLVAYSHFNLL